MAIHDLGKNTYRFGSEGTLMNSGRFPLRHGENDGQTIVEKAGKDAKEEIHEYHRVREAHKKSDHEYFDNPKEPANPLNPETEISPKLVEAEPVKVEEISLPMADKPAVVVEPAKIDHKPEMPKATTNQAKKPDTK